MMRVSIKQVVLGVIVCAAPAVYGMNLLRPYDTLIRPAYYSFDKFQLTLYAEGGLGFAHGYNLDGHAANPLQIYQCEQNALAMLDGFDENSLIGKKRIQVDANDDGVRGHFIPSADYSTRAAAAISARYFFCDGFFLNAHIPFFATKLSNVRWLDKTRDLTVEDQRVRTYLTNDFFASVAELGGLDLNGWERNGPGDTTIFAEWFRDFYQPRPLLQNVRMNIRLGVIIPTGKKRDEDRILALPFGTDGAFGLPYGIGLDLTMANYLKTGLDVQLTQLFGHTRCRRIKTAMNQTDFLFLAKVDAYENAGLVQRFNLYVELYRILRGFSFRTGYQYYKQGESEISLLSNQFSTNIANTAESLRDYTIHQIITYAYYDFLGDLPSDARVRPQIAAYARIPINGKRSFAQTMIGASVSFNF